MYKKCVQYIDFKPITPRSSFLERKHMSQLVSLVAAYVHGFFGSVPARRRNGRRSDAVPAMIERLEARALLSGTSIEMHRAYNPNADFHFLTTSQAEYNFVIAAGYLDESAGNNGFCVSATFGGALVGIGRVYNPNSGAHYYTSNFSEIESLVGFGWREEGTEGWIYPTQEPGAVEIFHLYNVKTGDHFYTVNATSKDAILDAFPGRWQQHGSLGWGFPIVNQGDLFVSMDATPLRSRQLLGGALGDEVLRLELRAQNEPIDVTDLHFLVTGESASIDRLELYKIGEISPFATVTFGATGFDNVPSGGSTMTARMQNQQLVIPEGQVQIISVRPRLKSDEQGAVSGHQFQVTIDPSSELDNASGDGAIHARGVTSSNNLSGNDGDSLAEGEVFIGRDAPGPNVGIVGQTETVVLSKITSIINANPDADGTNVPTGISAIGQFKFTAATNTNSLNGLNKVVIDELPLDVNIVNAALEWTAYYVYNKADPTSKFGASSGTVTATGVHLVFAGLSTSIVDTQIPMGATSTFVLQANITNSKVSTSQSTVQVTLDPSIIGWFDADITRTPITGFELSETVVKSTSYQS